MKISELEDRPGTPLEMNFDPCDDAIAFMRNDKFFYRRQYYPAVIELKDEVKNKKTTDPEKLFGDVVDSGMKTYCKKFDLGKLASEVFTIDDRTRMINQIHSDELENINNKEY